LGLVVHAVAVGAQRYQILRRVVGRILVCVMDTEIGAVKSFPLTRKRDECVRRLARHAAVAVALH
jgi:hypothetical protein